MSSRSSAESAASTSASSAQGCESSCNASKTPPPAESSPATGPESPASVTCVTLAQTGGNGSNLSEGEAPTLDSGTGIALYVGNQRREVREMEVAPALSSREGSTQAPFVSSPEGSPVRTSPSRVPGRDSRESEAASSSRRPESQTLFSEMAGGSSLRTYPDSFPRTADEISESFSRRWPSSGFTTSLGECWTADTSECPSDGGAFSSLPDVLLATVPERFFLSPKAAAGIIRRAHDRGKVLPPRLAADLAELASHLPDDDRKTTPTSSSVPSSVEASEATASGPMRSEPATLWEPSPPETTRDRDGRKASSSHRLSAPKATTPQRTAPDGNASSEASSPMRPEPCGGPATPSASTPPRTTPSLRRLTPTERERLQGFPDGWTIPYGPSLAPQSRVLTAPAKRRWATQSRSESPSGSAGACSPTRNPSTPSVSESPRPTHNTKESE